jgi:hypothetical protein
MGLSLYSVFSIDKLSEDHEGDGGSEEREDECEPKAVPSFDKQ